MRVIVPYTDLAPETRAALEADGITAEYVDCRASQERYYEVLAAAWADGEGFTVVEHDIVVNPGNVATLAACEEPWCGFPYFVSTTLLAGGLGFTRFSTAFLRTGSGVFDDIARLPFDGTPRRYWGRLDTRLKQVLEDQYKVQFHAHWPGVGHLHPGQADPIYNCARCGKAITSKVVLAGPPPYRCSRCNRRDSLTDKSTARGGA